MVSWSVSRHPEWDQLYRAGLTAREISSLSNRSVATVHYHLKRREYYEPGFYAEHAVALAKRRLNNVSFEWRRRAEELADFHSTHGRLPRSSGPQSERSLQYWLTRQRKLFEAGRLPPTKILLLHATPNWQVDVRQQELDDLWKEKLAALCTYYSDNGRFPRYRTSTTAEEKSLGIWLHNQHQRRSEGRLSHWRLDTLNQALPGWRSRS